LFSGKKEIIRLIYGVASVGSSTIGLY